MRKNEITAKKLGGGGRITPTSVPLIRHLFVLFLKLGITPKQRKVALQAKKRKGKKKSHKGCCGCQRLRGKLTRLQQ